MSDVRVVNMSIENQEARRLDQLPKINHCIVGVNPESFSELPSPSDEGHPQQVPSAKDEKQAPVPYFPADSLRLANVVLPRSSVIEPLPQSRVKDRRQS